MSRNNNKSTHLFTSREKGAVDRSIFLVAAFLLAAFTLCSLYAISQQPSSPASWSMAVFFASGLALLLFAEDNVLPDLNKNKLPFAGVAWFASWIFVAFLVSFLITYNWLHFFMAVLFALILTFGFSYSVTDKQGRKIIRMKTASGTKKGFNTAFNRKPKAKKPKKKKKAKKKTKKRIVSW